MIDTAPSSEGASVPASSVPAAAPTTDIASTSIASAVAGRTLIADKALRRIAVGVAAEVLQVAPGDVSVELWDAEGRLGATVTAPLRMSRLANRALASHADASDTVLARGEASRIAIAHRLEDLTGRSVGTVIIVFATAAIRQQRRTR